MSTTSAIVHIIAKNLLQTLLHSNVTFHLRISPILLFVSLVHIWEGSVAKWIKEP